MMAVYVVKHYKWHIQVPPNMRGTMKNIRKCHDKEYCLPCFLLGIQKRIFMQKLKAIYTYVKYLRYV